MAMLSYLRWILDNRFYLGDTIDVIDFPKPLKVSYNGKDYIEYLGITKRQRTYTHNNQPKSISIIRTRTIRLNLSK